MTLDEFFREQISRGQQPMVALNNAAQAYADSLRKRPDCSQYADETAAWDEPQENNEVEIQRRLRTFLHKANPGGCRVFSLGEQCQCPLCDLDRLFQLTNRSKDSEAVELLREGDRLMASRTTWTSAEMLWHDRVRNFLEGKQ